MQSKKQYPASFHALRAIVAELCCLTTAAYTIDYAVHSRQPAVYLVILAWSDLYRCCLTALGARMWPSRAVSNLQKTYDESYLRCSTAVYYEGQVGISTFQVRSVGQT